MFGKSFIMDACVVYEYSLFISSPNMFSCVQFHEQSEPYIVPQTVFVYVLKKLLHFIHNEMFLEITSLTLKIHNFLKV